MPSTSPDLPNLIALREGDAPSQGNLQREIARSRKKAKPKRPKPYAAGGLGPIEANTF